MSIKKVIYPALALALAMCLTMASALAAGNEERTTITYAMWGSNDDVRALEESIMRFESGQKRVYVQILHIDRADYIDTLNALAADNALPDAALMAEDAVMMLANQHMLADLSAMYGEGEAKPLDSLAFIFEGAPVGYSAANEILLLFYNREAFIQSGVIPPPAEVDDAWDWDTFVNAAKAMTRDENGNNAESPVFDPDKIARHGVIFNPSIWQTEVWSISNGGAWYDESGNVAINTPEATGALQRVADLHLVHRASPRFGAHTAAAAAQAFIDGKSAMYISGQWEIGAALGPAKQSGGLDYGVGVLPYMMEKVTISTGGANIAFANSKNLDAAMEWLKWYAGIENTWSLIESGVWMPALPEYYKDGALTRKWAENPHFPPYEEYKSAVVDYAANSARPAAWYRVNNTNLFNGALESILMPCWAGTATMADAIARNMDALIAANQNK
jgi:multiple sugar transport system substrate-binding protein